MAITSLGKNVIRQSSYKGKASQSKDWIFDIDRRPAKIAGHVELIPHKLLLVSSHLKLAQEEHPKERSTTCTTGD